MVGYKDGNHRIQKFVWCRDKKEKDHTLISAHQFDPHRIQAITDEKINVDLALLCTPLSQATLREEDSKFVMRLGRFTPMHRDCCVRRNMEMPRYGSF